MYPHLSEMEIPEQRTLWELNLVILSLQRVILCAEVGQYNTLSAVQPQHGKNRM